MGDCNLTLNVHEIQEKTLKTSKEAILLNFKIPFDNTGKQQAIILDGVFRLQPEGDKYDKFDISSRLLNPEFPVYHDNYWEAFLLKPGEKLWLKGKIKVDFKDKTALNPQDLPEVMYFDLSYKYYGRNPIKYEKKEIILKTKEFDIISNDVNTSSQETVIKPERKPLDESIKTIPVKTHILRESDDLMEVLKKYVIPLSSPGDILAIAESVVAILQGRALYIEDIKPCYIATRINRFFQQDASLSSPYSLQMAIKEAGTIRIILAFLIGILGKLTGRKGDFYRIAGRAATTIDDPPGTMPPFDKSVVLGPKAPQKLVEEIKLKTNLDATIVDANDLGKVDVLASTLKNNELIVRALTHNPQGNADEQTPIVLIRQIK